MRKVYKGWLPAQSIVDIVVVRDPDTGQPVEADALPTATLRSALLPSSSLGDLAVAHASDPPIVPDGTYRIEFGTISPLTANLYIYTFAAIVGGETFRFVSGPFCVETSPLFIELDVVGSNTTAAGLVMTIRDFSTTASPMAPSDFPDDAFNGCLISFDEDVWDPAVHIPPVADGWAGGVRRVTGFDSTTGIITWDPPLSAPPASAKARLIPR